MDTLKRTNRTVERLAKTSADSYKVVVDHVVAQRDTYRTLAGEWADAYTDLLYAPFFYYRQGLRLAEDQVEDATFPIAGYDELNVREISQRLEGLSAAEIRKVREYEKRNKNRETLIEQFDRKLRAVSA